MPPTSHRPPPAEDAHGDPARPAEPPLAYETELKLALASAEDAERLRQALPPPSRSVTQRNLFLDTAAQDLSRERWALRLRLEREESPPRETALLALKGPARQVAGALHRVDVEAPLPSDRWHDAHQSGGIPLAALTGPAAELVRGRLPPDALLQVRVAFENQRIVHPLVLAGAPREVLVDCTHFATGEVEHEVEVELALPGPPEAAASRLLIVAAGQELEALLARAGAKTAPPPGGKYSRSLAYAERAGGLSFPRRTP